MKVKMNKKKNGYTIKMKSGKKMPMMTNKEMNDTMKEEMGMGDTKKDMIGDN